MGMDVYGKAPTADVGRYFRNNVWWWHPLWDYVETVAPHLTEGVSGRYNDGDGLNAAAADRLAAILSAELDSGRATCYAAERDAAIATMPDQPCSLCGGTGTRSDLLARERGWDTPHGCNGCGGTGQVRPHEESYGFSVENVADFRDFVAASGGFEVW